MDNVKFLLGFLIDSRNINLDAKTIINYSEHFSKYFNTQFTQLTFGVHRDNKPEKYKTYKLKPSNLEKLSNQKNISGVSFERIERQDEPDFYGPTSSVDFTLSNETNWPTILIASLDSQILSERFSLREITNFLQGTLDYGFEIKSGLIHFMHESKLPLFYLTGTLTSNITKEEELICKALNNRIREYKDKIWDIFWCNVVAKEIISISVLEKIKEVINEDNIIEYRNDYLFFLPIDYQEYIYNKEKADFYKNKLRIIFNEENKIMYCPKSK